jgi:hypothetical protein
LKAKELVILQPLTGVAAINPGNRKDIFAGVFLSVDDSIYITNVQAP